MTRCSVFVRGSTTGCFCRADFSIGSARTNIAAGCFPANLSALPSLAGPVQQPNCLPYRDVTPVYVSKYTVCRLTHNIMDLPKTIIS